MKADIGVMLLQAKEHRRVPQTTGSQETGTEQILLTALRSNQSCQHLDLGFLASRTVRKYISVI